MSISLFSFPESSNFRIPFPLFFNFINIESFSVVVDADAQDIVAVRKLHYNIGRICIFDGIVDGFLRQAIDVYFN